MNLFFSLFWNGDYELGDGGNGNTAFLRGFVSFYLGKGKGGGDGEGMVREI